MHELNGYMFQTFMHHISKDENIQDQEIKKCFQNFWKIKVFKELVIIVKNEFSLVNTFSFCWVIWTKFWCFEGHDFE